MSVQPDSRCLLAFVTLDLCSGIRCLFATNKTRIKGTKLRILSLAITSCEAFRNSSCVWPQLHASLKDAVRTDFIFFNGLQPLSSLIPSVPGHL